jgi:hypothetical protein
MRRSLEGSARAPSQVGIRIVRATNPACTGSGLVNPDHAAYAFFIEDLDEEANRRTARMYTGSKNRTDQIRRRSWATNIRGICAYALIEVGTQQFHLENLIAHLLEGY